MTIIDISVPLRSSMVVWPGDRPVEVRRAKSLEEHGANISELCLGSHAGTHLDASLHFVAGGRTVDQLPLGVLTGPADVADLSGVESVITPRDLEAAALPADCRRLLLRTRNSLYWERAADVFHEDYVALSADAADWVVRRGIQLVGIDYLSIEPYHSQGHPVHRALLGAQVIIVETIDLSRVAAGRYQLSCLPLLIAGADGAPARAILSG